MTLQPCKNQKAFEGLKTPRRHASTGSETQLRRVGQVSILLACCIVLLLLTRGAQPANSESPLSEPLGDEIANAEMMCTDGAERSCRIRGRDGFQFCNRGRWSRCIPEEPEPSPTPSGTGAVRPKYYVLTVVYSPPGTEGGRSSSSVKYGSGSTTGTTVSTTSAFKQNYKVSVSADVGFLGTGGSIGTSFAYGRNSANTGTVDIKKSGTTEIAQSGPPVDGIDHDRDIIYLWLNPTLSVTVTPTSASWKLADNITADIQFLYVGWLKNPSLIPPGVAQRLQAHGITSQDFPEILKADPFANGNTAIDPMRYQMVNTTFPYEPPFADGDPVPTFSFVLSYTNGATATSSVQNDYTLGLNVSGGFNFLSLFKTSVKNENSWTWTCIDTRVSTSGTSEAASVTVGGPSFGYTGPTDMGVYYDTLYKTFMFAPIETTLRALSGAVKSRSGRPASGKEVTVTMANGAKFRTFTNAKGEYRVFGRVSGPLRLKVGSTTKNLPTLPANRQANITLP